MTQGVASKIVLPQSKTGLFTDVAAQSTTGSVIGASSFWNNDGTFGEADSGTYPFSSRGNATYAVLAVTIPDVASALGVVYVDQDLNGVAGVGNPATFTSQFSFNQYGQASRFIIVPLFWPYFRVYIGSSVGDTVVCNAKTTSIVPPDMGSTEANLHEISDMASLIHTRISDPVSGVITKNYAPSSATLSNIALSTTSVNILSSGTTAYSTIIWNDSAAKLYLKYGTTASATSFTTIVQPNSGWIDNYGGRVDGILQTGTGTARVTRMI